MSKYLQTERALDLVPDDDAEVDADSDEAEEDEPEAKSGALGLLSTVTVGTPPRSMQFVRPLDGDRIELERLVHHFRVPGRLGHMGSLNGGLVFHGRSGVLFETK